MNTEVMGVRGSGQSYGLSPELAAVESHLPGSIGFTELSSNIPVLHGLPDYQAVSVSDHGFLNGVGAGALFISRLNMGKYRASVDSGKTLLKKYIESFQPTDTCLVLVGYSQGAQVVNETVRDMHKADPNSLKSIIYIGLFGDPMYSPLGFDLSRKPSWLRGDALYPFYGSLFKDVGMPGVETPDYVPRNPTNPKVPFTKIGSWCNYGDIVCAVDVEHDFAMRDGHGTYVDNAAEMVDEIKAAVANPDQNITNAIYPKSTCGAAKQDMVVLLDTSAYMRRDRNLFTKAKNTWDYKTITTADGKTIHLYRTFGEQLLDSGCGDKRVAIVGYEGPSGRSPRLLLDFTTKAQDIDDLMDSLYQPSSGGIAERPQLREAAILAMQQNWRVDASRTLFAISSMAGSGTATAAWQETWMSPGVRNGYMNDAVGQRLLALSRQTHASMIASVRLPIDMRGFTIPSGAPGANDAYNYFQAMAWLTGGYNWEKDFITYPSSQSVKNINFSDEIKQFETRRDGSRVAMKSIQAKVGQPVTLELDDSVNLLASAALRGHGNSTVWFLDCDALQKQTDYPAIKRVGDKVTFTPTKAGSCTAAVRVAVQGSGNGCYWGCPEIFPPYILKVIPFMIDIRPADYVDKVPGNITTMTKTIYDDRIEFSWLPPAYNGDDLAYLVKDMDGSVLAATTTARATMTDIAKQDDNIIVQAVGIDGRSEEFNSSGDSVKVADERTQPKQATVATSSGSISPADITSHTNTTFDGVAVMNKPDMADGHILGDSVASVVMEHTSAHVGDVAPGPAKTPNGARWWLVPLVLIGGFVGLRVRSAIRRR